MGDYDRTITSIKTNYIEDLRVELYISSDSVNYVPFSVDLIQRKADEQHGNNKE